MAIIQEDNFVRTRYYKQCVTCEGYGKIPITIRSGGLSWNTNPLRCESCHGCGSILLCERVMTRVAQPFPLATD